MMMMMMMTIPVVFYNINNDKLNSNTMYKIKQNIKPPSHPQQNIGNIYARRILDESKENDISKFNREELYHHAQPNTISINTKQYGNINNQHTMCTIEQGNSDTWGGNNKKPLITPINKMDKLEQMERFQNASKQKQRMFNYHSRSKSQRQARQLCVNHNGKDAEYRLIIQDQIMFYCVKCAVKLASQGFLVQKLYADRSNQHQYNHRNLHIKPNYHQSQNYHLLSQFLNYVTQIEHQHTSTMQKLAQIDTHYKQQVQNTECFYEELLAFVEQMRDDHLMDLEQKQRRDSQIAMIQHDYLRGNIQEIDVIWRDVEVNLENIVQKMSEEQLKTHLKFYRYKVQVFGHKVEQLQEFFDKVIDFKEEVYHHKLNKSQQYLMQVWNQDHFQSEAVENQQRQTRSEILPNDFMNIQSRHSAPKRNYENLLIKPSELFKIQNQQTLKFKPQPADKQKKTSAFRILFTEDEQNLSNSPQIRNI